MYKLQLLNLLCMCITVIGIHVYCNYFVIHVYCSYWIHYLYIWQLSNLLCMCTSYWICYICVLQLLNLLYMCTAVIEFVIYVHCSYFVIRVLQLLNSWFIYIWQLSNLLCTSTSYWSCYTWVLYLLNFFVCNLSYWFSCVCTAVIKFVIPVLQFCVFVRCTSAIIYLPYVYCSIA